MRSVFPCWRPVPLLPHWVLSEWPRAEEPLDRGETCWAGTPKVNSIRDNGGHMKHTSVDVCSKYHVMNIFTMMKFWNSKKKKEREKKMYGKVIKWLFPQINLWVKRETVFHQSLKVVKNTATQNAVPFFDVKVCKKVRGKVPFMRNSPWDWRSHDSKAI